MKPLLAISCILLALIPEYTCAQGQRELDEINEKIETQKANIEFLKGRVAETQAKVEEVRDAATRVEKAMARSQELTQKNRNFELELPNLEGSMFRLASVLEAYKTNFRPKHNLVVGQVFSNVKTNDGQTISGRVTEIGEKVKLRHANGFTLVAIDDLPVEVMKGSVVAPKTLERPEFSPTETKKMRPMESIGYELRAEIERKDREERDAERQRERDEMEQEGQRRRAEMIAAQQERDKKRAANSEYNKQIQGKIDAIRSQSRALEEQQRKLVSLKQSKQREYDSSKIKGDRKAFENSLIQIDKNHSALGAQIRALELEVSKLRRSMRY